MKLFYARTETENQIAIAYNPYFLYTILGMFIASYAARYIGLPEGVSTGLSLVMLVLVIWRVFDMRSVRKEIKDAMRGGSGITVSGSQLKPSEPYTVKIQKTNNA